MGNNVLIKVSIVPNSNKVVKRRGNTPVHMRSKVSQSFLSQNPEYKPLFKKCPVCSNHSFKPYNGGRKCTQCDYFNNSS